MTFLSQSNPLGPSIGEESGRKRGDKRGHPAFDGKTSLTFEDIFILIDFGFLF